MTDSRDIGIHFAAIGQANTSDLTQSGVRFLWRRRKNAKTHATTLRGSLKIRRLGRLRLRAAPFANELLNGRHCPTLTFRIAPRDPNTGITRREKCKHATPLARIAVAKGPVTRTSQGTPPPVRDRTAKDAVCWLKNCRTLATCVFLSTRFPAGKVLFPSGKPHYPVSGAPPPSTTSAGCASPLAADSSVSRPSSRDTSKLACWARISSGTSIWMPTLP